MEGEEDRDRTGSRDGRTYRVTGIDSALEDGGTGGGREVEGYKCERETF